MKLLLLVMLMLPSVSEAWIVTAGEAYDGDTFYLTLPESNLPRPLNKLKVRLIGIDAPELGSKAKCLSEEEVAIKAKTLLNSLVAGKSVELMNIKWDEYGGRIDANVKVGEINVSQEMLKSGLVRKYKNKRESWCTVP